MMFVVFKQLDKDAINKKNQFPLFASFTGNNTFHQINRNLNNECYVIKVRADSILRLFTMIIQIKTSFEWFSLCAIKKYSR